VPQVTLFHPGFRLFCGLLIPRLIAHFGSTYLDNFPQNFPNWCSTSTCTLTILLLRFSMTTNGADNPYDLANSSCQRNAAQAAHPNYDACA